MACGACGQEGHNRRTHRDHPEPQADALLESLPPVPDGHRPGRTADEVRSALREALGHDLGDSVAARGAVAGTALAGGLVAGALVREAAASVALDRDQTHALGGTWHGHGPGCTVSQPCSECRPAGDRLPAIPEPPGQLIDFEPLDDRPGDLIGVEEVAAEFRAYAAEVEEVVAAMPEPDADRDLLPIPPWRTIRMRDEPIRITRPGVYHLDAAEYHDPAITGDWLSNSDARQLIAPGCPAQFRYDRDHGVRKTSDAFSMGHAVHARILGKGETIAVRPAEFDSWRTNAAKGWRAEQEAAGRSVILPEQAEVVEAMAAAVHRDRWAHALLSQPGGPELALFWVDPETGVRRRALVDYLPSQTNERGMIRPVDLKSADEVAPDESMERKLYDHAWHRQATTIADGIEVLGLARSTDFYFIVQSKRAPHLVTVVRLDAEAERIGRIENRQALLVYKECMETGVWPGFADEPVTMSVPPWKAAIYADEIEVC
jgi:hypothetical protein